MSPLKPIEFLIALMIMSIIRLAIGVVRAGLLSTGNSGGRPNSPIGINDSHLGWSACRESRRKQFYCRKRMIRRENIVASRTPAHRIAT
jgi:hypothetical protein